MSNLSNATYGGQTPACQQGARAPLGNITKSTFTQAQSDDDKRLGSRRTRYAMQAMSAQVLRNHRVTSCQKVPSYGVQNGVGTRGISRNEHGHAHFHGVGSCGDVWACPVCSQRISEGRRGEVLQAMAEHRKNGGVAVLVTWTFSHKRNDDLGAMVKGFTKALSVMKGRRAFKRVTENLDYSGQIRALEVTHSDANGWHPHAHEIWFLDSIPTPDQLSLAKDQLFDLWENIAVKQGLGRPSKQHGIDIQYRDSSGAEAVGAYVSKWGFELTYAHMKSGKDGSRTPWGILSDLTNNFVYRDSKLWEEYTKAFKGRAQMFWSRGLKDRFGINDFDDTEMADRPESEIIVELNSEQWLAIIKTNKRAEVLEMAEKQPLFLGEFIQELVDEVASWSRDRARLKRRIVDQTRGHLVDIGLSNTHF
ncbi:MAG: protein rep [Bacteroidota bacterium]